MRHTRLFPGLADEPPGEVVPPTDHVRAEAQQVTNETEVVLVWEKEKGFVISKD